MRMGYIDCTNSIKNRLLWEVLYNSIWIYMNLKDVSHQASSELRTPTRAIGQIQHVAELLWQEDVWSNCGRIQRSRPEWPKEESLKGTSNRHFKLRPSQIWSIQIFSAVQSPSARTSGSMTKPYFSISFAAFQVRRRCSLDPLPHFF